MNILIVDRYQIIRLATKALLLGVFDQPLIQEAGTFRQMMQQLSLRTFDLIILDAQLPDAEGFDMIKQVRKSQLSTPILVFSAFEERIYGIHFLRAGANGFVSKNSATIELRESIISVVQSGQYVSSKIKIELLNQMNEVGYCPDNPLVGLSAREISVMDMLMQGLWSKEIASKLRLKESSISSCKAGLFDKLAVSSLIQFSQRVDFYKQLG